MWAIEARTDDNRPLDPPQWWMRPYPSAASPATDKDRMPIATAEPERTFTWGSYEEAEAAFETIPKSEWERWAMVPAPKVPPKKGSRK